MTRDELAKRLFKIQGTPYREPVAPRDSVRRDFNNIEEEKDSNNNFESFFDFEKEMSDIAPARDQFEKVNQQVKSDESLNVSNESFLVMEQDLNLKSGDNDSFFVFEEDNSEPTIYKDIMEDVSSIGKVEDDSISKLEVIDIVYSQENITVKSDLEETIQNNSASFKLCKYVKETGESCKRQSPKTSDYCSSHRKLLAKKSE